LTSRSKTFVDDQASPTSKKYLPEAMGSGVALFDDDNDGRLDIFFANGAPITDPTAPGTRALHGLGRAQIGLGHPPHASDTFSRCTKLNPKDASGRHALGLTLVSLEKLTDARGISALHRNPAKPNRLSRRPRKIGSGRGKNG